MSRWTSVLGGIACLCDSFTLTKMWVENFSTCVYTVASFKERDNFLPPSAPPAPPAYTAIDYFLIESPYP